ncbi:MAG: class II aldolase/adducin family protein [Candidatus Eisenbacteria bacterium]|nr:class II aldolase/adducin family protein [Candidatus Eisenbacteria bacterium]
MTPDFRLRRDIVEVGRRVWQRGFVAANDGNISARLSDGRILITPTGRSKGFMEPDDLVVVDASGERSTGRLKPTSELPMHLFVYEARPDVSAIVHAHPPRATGFAVAGVHLAQCVLPEVILTLGGVPLTEYATPSTNEVPASIEEYIRSYNALLLRSHGALTLGGDVFEAYYRMETVEHFAEITLAARALGGASPLSDEEVRKLMNVRESLGLRGPAGTCVSCGACETTRTGEPEPAASGRGDRPEASGSAQEPGSTPKPGAPESGSIPPQHSGSPRLPDGPTAAPSERAQESDDGDIIEEVLARLRSSLAREPEGRDSE